MKFKWLNKKNNRELIVFFNGWGFDETAVSQLGCEDFDVLVFYNYKNFNFDFSVFNFENYEKKYLICWSMGVYAVNLFKEVFDSFNKKIAINGTQKMIDDNFGIPKRIYNLTLRHFNEASCDKFVQNMFNSSNTENNIKPAGTCEELKNELESLNNIEFKEIITFDKAYISNDDKIVPSQNQLNYWVHITQTSLLNAPHYPFHLFKYWEELL